jgi:MraZ protein
MADALPFYYGCAENKLNTKGQVAIPARFRAALPEEGENKNFVIIRGEPNCLSMYTHRQFAVIKENARRVAQETGDSAFFRAFMAEAHSVDVDTQGRFVLPQQLMKLVGLAGPGVKFVGVDDRIEIWDPERYDAACAIGSAYEEQRRNAAKRIFGGL